MLFALTYIYIMYHNKKDIRDSPCPMSKYHIVWNDMYKPVMHSWTKLELQVVSRKQQSMPNLQNITVYAQSPNITVYAQSLNITYHLVQQ